MKNYFWPLIISLTPFFSMAQESRGNTALGFTLTPNISWLSSGEQSKSDGPAVGFSYGVIADLAFSENYFFATGFTLSSMNSKAIATGDVRTESTYHFQYIEVPLTLKLKNSSGDNTSFYGQFGLGTGIKVRATEDYSQRDASGNTAVGEDVNISKKVNPFRLGLIAGAGAEWKIGRNLSLLTGVTYNNGFTTVLKESSQRNSYLALNLGVFF